MVPAPKDPPDRSDVKMVWVSLSKERAHATVQLRNGQWQEVSVDYAISIVGAMPSTNHTPAA